MNFDTSATRSFDHFPAVGSYFQDDEEKLVSDLIGISLDDMESPAMKSSLSSDQKASAFSMVIWIRIDFI